VIGQTIRLAGQPFTIVGVTAKVRGQNMACRRGYEPASMKNFCALFARRQKYSGRGQRLQAWS
jgi:hypothetical protein